jgi:hypothetical protein
MCSALRPPMLYPSGLALLTQRVGGLDREPDPGRDLLARRNDTRPNIGCNLYDLGTASDSTGRSRKLSSLRLLVPVSLVP